VTAAATDKYDKMRASIKEAAISLGGYLSPATEGVAGWFSNAASAAGDFFKRATETSLETTIREMKELGGATLDLELALAKITKAEVAYKAAVAELKPEDRVALEQAITDSGERQLELLGERGRLQAALLNEGLKEKDLRETIWRAEHLQFSGRDADYKAYITHEATIARLKLQGIDSINQQLQAEKDIVTSSTQHLSLLTQLEAAQERVLAIQEAQRQAASGDDADTSGQDEQIAKMKELTDAEKSRLYQLALALNGVQALTMETENFGISSINTYENLATYEQDSIDRQGDYTTSFGERTASVIALTHRVTLAAQGDMNAIASQWKEGAVLAKRVAQFNVLLNAKEAIVAAYKSAATVPYIGFLLAPAAAAAAAAATWAQVRSIEAQSFAMGGSFQTSGRRLIDVGDNYGGREQVDITPISSPNYAGPKTGRAASEVHFHNPIMTRDFIREEVHEELQRLERLNA